MRNYELYDVDAISSTGLIGTLSRAVPQTEQHLTMHNV